MKIFYPLKKSEPADLVEPIVHYLEESQGAKTAFTFRENLTKINLLRNKVTSLELERKPTIAQFDKKIAALQMYCRFALLMAKHLNWNPEYGPIVKDLKLIWGESFSPSIKYQRAEIHFDIFCCFYNLGILYFHKASILSMQDLINSRKESIKLGRVGYYIFNKLKTQYYPSYVNCAFSDTNYAHIEMLESICLGLCYKNLFNLLKEDQYKIGIDKIANIAGHARKSFYLAYQIGTQYFMKSSHITIAIKSELLSLSYVESLYHDVMCNIKLAKYYQQQMDNDKQNIKNLLAYQRKALRLLNLGLQNQSVIPLIKQRPQQKKQLQQLLPEIKYNLDKNILRNNQIYHQKQITQNQLQPLSQLPKQHLVKLVQPPNLIVKYDDAITSPFANLIDNQSKGFMLELELFIKNRTQGMQSASAKLNKNVQLIYNNNYVNFYLNLENQKTQKGLPESLKQKINQIKANGGKQKIQMQVKIIKSNEQQVQNRFAELGQILHEEQLYDIKKRSQYGAEWKRPPSAAMNRPYVSQIQVYSKKAQQAHIVNQKVLQKYEKLVKYIEVIDGSENQIMSIVPKVQVTQFIQQNKNQFETLKKSNEEMQKKKKHLQDLAFSIKKSFNQMKLNEVANKYFKQAQGNRQQAFNLIFQSPYQKIKQFNSLAKCIEQQADKVGKISLKLNSLNKTNDNSKQNFEEVMGSFTEVAGLFRELNQGTSFYTKLNDILARMDSDLQGYLAARKLQAQELEQSIKKGNPKGGPNLPSMYPGQQPQQNLGFYIPPPMQSSNDPSQTQNQIGGPSNIGDMLANLMATRIQYNSDNIFRGQVHDSKYKK